MEERIYDVEEAIRFLKVAGITLPSDEKDIFVEEFNKLYRSYIRYDSLIGTLWDIYSQILPFKAHPDRDERRSYLDHISRDRIFNNAVIVSGLSEKLKSGISINQLELEDN